MHYFWHNNSTSVKIGAITTIGASAYLFFIDGESFLGWVVFFVALALTILLSTIDEQHKELEALRHPKEEDVTNEKKEPVDPRSYDPFYISDAHNPNREKVTKKKEEIQVIFRKNNGNGDVDEDIKR